MPSSTSSSDPEAARGARPDAPAGDVADDAASRRAARSLDVPAVATAALFLALVVGLELGARAAGFRPSVTDDAALFARARHRATAAGPDAVVLLGKSRIQLGFDGETFAARFPDRPLVQLAVHGKSAFAVLADLARDEAFTGTVLFSFTEEDLTRGARDEAQPLLDESRAFATLPARLEGALDAAVESRLAVANPQLGLGTVIGALLDDGALPAPHFTVTGPDRTQRADFTRTDAAAMRATYDRIRADADRALGGRAIDDGRWLAEARAVIPVVDALKARGARVIFLKFLHCDDADRASERWYPRARFFDAIAREARVPAVHYRDVPGWDAVPCPDSSHVDARDAPRWTSALLDELAGRDLLEPPRRRPR